MPEKKKPNKQQRREIRLRKARQWVLTYEGKHIIRAYRKRFKVNYQCALSDLGEIGALQPEKLVALQQAEKARLEKRRKEREAKRLQDMVNGNPFSDDQFYFIAGYTSGGAPYGITWEEMGMEPWEIIAYRIIQSFKPGEITPEEANKLGYELAMKFTGGCHQFVVSTHTDKAHIHNHVEFNSTNLNCDGKFNNVKNSSRILQKLNDRICQEHGYSVIEHPKGKGQAYTEKAAAKQGRSFKERLRQTIDRVLPGCRDFEEFLSRMRNEGYEVRRRGKSLEFRAPGQLKFTRSYRLENGYDEAGLQERIAGNITKRKTEKKKPDAAKKKVNLLIDIQAKMQAGKGKGYERWAKVFNLKEAANILNFLTEHGITDDEELTERTEETGKKFDALSVQIKQFEGRMAQTAQLKMHIINYSKTREIYAAYKKSGKKEVFLAEHKEEIKKHEAAKAAFEALKGKPIPKVA